MKKVLLLLIITITSVSYGNSIKEKEVEIEFIKETGTNFFSKSEDDFGRQCCTKAYVNPNTNEFYSFTACAGWFLSNDANAMTNACGKADKMLQDSWAINELTVDDFLN